MCQKIDGLHKEMQALKKIPKMLCDKEQSLEKIVQFKNKLQKTFVFWPRHISNKISSKKDRLLLLNMMGPRTASFGGTDKTFAATSTKIEQRKAEQQRQLKEQKRVKTDSMLLLFVADFNQ